MPDSADHEQDFDRIIDAAARLWLADQETTMNSHPEIEVLIAFQQGELEGAQADTMRAHIEGCEQCREELASFEAFDASEPEAAVSPSEEAILAASWRAFEARRELEQIKSAQTPDNVIRDPRFLPRPAVWLAVAALLLAALGAAYFLFSSRLGPEADTAVAGAWPIDPVPDDTSLTRSAEVVETFDVPTGRDQILAMLRLGDQTPYRGYLAVVYGEAGEVEAEVDQLVRDSLGRVPVTLPRARLPGGKVHRLVLYGMGDENQRTELATYSFRLRDVG